MPDNESREEVVPPIIGTTQKTLESHNFIHGNGNLFCAIEVKTTGLDATRHEIYEIAVIPVTNVFERSQTIPWLDLSIQPNNEEEIDWGGSYKCFQTKDLKSAIASGFTRDTAFDLILQWFEERNLNGKRIVPICYGWEFDSHFIRSNFGEVFYNKIFFDHMARDIRVLANFLNDVSWHRDEKFPFNMYTQDWMRSALKIKSFVGRNAVCGAATTLEIYKGLLDLMHRRLSAAPIDSFMEIKPASY